MIVPSYHVFMASIALLAAVINAEFTDFIRQFQINDTVTLYIDGSKMDISISIGYILIGSALFSSELNFKL